MFHKIIKGLIQCISPFICVKSFSDIAFLYIIYRQECMISLCFLFSQLVDLIKDHII